MLPYGCYKVYMYVSSCYIRDIVYNKSDIAYYDSLHSRLKTNGFTAVVRKMALLLYRFHGQRVSLKRFILEVFIVHNHNRNWLMFLVSGLTLRFCLCSSKTHFCIKTLLILIVIRGINRLITFIKVAFLSILLIT